MKNFPNIIKRLPKANIGFKGVQGWISQADEHQIVFMEIEPIGKVAEHAHGAQWGIVVEGEMRLTIGDETKTYRKGDTYYIPAGVVHSAEFITKTFVIDYFDEKQRYKKKPDSA